MVDHDRSRHGVALLGIVDDARDLNALSPPWRHGTLTAPMNDAERMDRALRSTAHTAPADRHTGWRWTERDRELDRLLGWWGETVYRQADRQDDGRVPCRGGPVAGATILTSRAYPFALLFDDPQSPTGWVMVRVGEENVRIRAPNGGLRLPLLVSYDYALSLWDEGDVTIRGAYARTEQGRSLAMEWREGHLAHEAIQSHYARARR